jgi:hypothetical protein
MGQQPRRGPFRLASSHQSPTEAISPVYATASTSSESGVDTAAPPRNRQSPAGGSTRGPLAPRTPSGCRLAYGREPRPSSEAAAPREARPTEARTHAAAAARLAVPPYFGDPRCPRGAASARPAPVALRRLDVARSRMQWRPDQAFA